MMTRKSRRRQTMKSSMSACLLMSAPPSLAAAHAQLPAAGAQRSSMRSILSRSTTCSPQWLLQARPGPSHALHHLSRRGVWPMELGYLISSCTGSSSAVLHGSADEVSIWQMKPNQRLTALVGSVCDKQCGKQVGMERHYILEM